MTKLCPRGKAAAKRKFAVYPSAYANAYASKICAGKIKDPSGVKRKDFKGPKPMKQGDMVNVKKYGSGALSQTDPNGPMAMEDERNIKSVSPYYDKTIEATSGAQAQSKKEKLGADVDTKVGTFGIEVGKGSTIFPGGDDLQEKTGQLRYGKSFNLSDRTKLDLGGSYGRRESEFKGYPESKKKDNTYNVGGRLTYQLKKSGGLAKEAELKNVKGGFEEGDYQDYVLDLIK